MAEIISDADWALAEDAVFTAVLNLPSGTIVVAVLPDGSFIRACESDSCPGHTVKF